VFDSQHGAMLFASNDDMDDDDDDDLFTVMSKSSKAAKSVSEFLWLCITSLSVTL